MKKLLNTLYVVDSDRYLSLDGQNIVVIQGNNEIGRVPLHNIDGIVTFGYSGASPALMCECAVRNIQLVFLSKNGKFMARVSGKQYGNVLLRKEQYRTADDLGKSLSIAKNMIIGKLFNSRWVLERACRDYSMRIDVSSLKNKSRFIYESIKRIEDIKDIEALRGCEGEAASMYFSVFDELLLQQKEDFFFTKRSKHPPLDNVNALLSFAYTLLTSMCVSALETVGLDPYVGYMHTARPGRCSLALDLVEELRSVFADRFVITLINLKIITIQDFTVLDNDAVYLSERGRKTFLCEWQKKKQETIVHPFLNEKVEWGLIPFVQAMLLARYLRGDIDAYPPFLWK